MTQNNQQKDPPTANGDAPPHLTAEQLALEYRQRIGWPSKLEVMVTGPSRKEVEDGLMRDPVARFVEDHRMQLRTMSLPKKLWQTLFAKLHHETFDAGQKFQIQMLCEEDDPDDDSTFERQVAALETIEAESDVFLVDHAMTWSTEEEATEALASNPQLMARIEALCEAEGEELTAEADEKERKERRLKSLLGLIREKAESYTSLGKRV